MRFLLVLAASIYWQSSLTVSAQNPVNITFLHINDPHTHIESHELDLPAEMIPKNLSTNATSLRMEYGGAGRIVSLIHSQKDEVEQTGIDVITLHAGDALTGTLFYTAYGPSVDIAWMNAAGVFDAMVVGNHEFDYGDKTLAEFVKGVNTTVISHNLRPGPDSPLSQLPEEKKIRPYYIHTLKNGDRVGVCGITIKITTEQSSNPDDGTTLEDEVEATKQCVSEIEELGINKIVALTHTGYYVDMDSLSNITGVDMIIGGHEHAFLGDTAVFEKWGLPIRGPYATMTNGVCIVTAWEFNKVLGRLDVSFDENGTVTSCLGGPLIPYDSSKYEVTDVESEEKVYLSEDDSALVTASIATIPAFIAVVGDEAVAAALDPFFKQIETVKNDVIGKVAENICHTRRGDGVDSLCPDRPDQSLVGGGVCILVSEAYLYNVPTANFAIQNAGACRTDILQGDLTLGDVFGLLPFSSTLVTIVIKGEQIQRLLEQSVSFFLDETGGTGSYPVGADIRWDLNMTAVNGSRFSNIEVKEDKKWVPMDPTKSYTVATNSFAAEGGDGYDVFTEVDQTDSSLYLNTFIEYGQAFVNYAESVDELTEPPLSEYSTQYLVDEKGEIVSLRELREETKAPEDGEETGSPTSTPAGPAAPPTAPVKSSCTRVEVIFAVASGLLGFFLAA